MESLQFKTYLIFKKGNVNIPKKIKVGGHEYSVLFVNNDTRFAKSGDVCPYTKTIKINNGDLAPESQIAETLFHELIEIVDSSCELKLDHSAISILSEQLFAIIRNNNLDFRKKD